MVLTNLKKTFCFAAIGLLIAGNIFAAKVPQLSGRVNDYANIINRNTEEKLEAYLRQLDEQQGVQIAVLTVPNIGGDDIASYSMKVAEQWKLGNAKTDKGALLIVAYNEHDLRIEVGYGLEDKLTDAKCGLIIRNVIIPQFKNGDYSEGILLGIQNMGGIATDNAELVSQSVQKEEEDDSLGGVAFMIVWLIFFFLIISSKGGIWKWIFLSSLTSGRRHYGNFGSFGGRSGFGGSSGFSGGSFHGGGGHFGGGGASGHW